MASPDSKRKRPAKPPSARRPAKGGASAAPPAAPPSEAPSDVDAAAYLDALVKAGQAVPAAPSKPLPPGATHVIERDDDGAVRVVRRRFSIG